MDANAWLLLSLAVTGIADVWCERLTGEGLIGHVQDWLERWRGRWPLPPHRVPLRCVLRGGMGMRADIGRTDAPTAESAASPDVVATSAVGIEARAVRVLATVRDWMRDRLEELIELLRLFRSKL